MDDRYFHGIIGCREVVCGRPLVSLTPWHITLLEGIGSPIVTEGEVLTTAHILIFLKIASVQWPETPDLKPSFKDAYWASRMKKQKVFLRETRKLKKWLSVQLSVPKLWKVTSHVDIGKSLTSPAMLSLVMALVSKVRVTLAEAWNMRLGEARWYDTCKAEMEGAKLTIAYESDAEEMSDVNDLPESEIIAIAREQLPKETFRKWYNDRVKNRKK